MKEKILKVINEKNKKKHSEKRKSTIINGESLSFNLFGNFLPLILLFIFTDYFKKKFFNFLFVLFLFLAFFSTYIGLKKIINNSKKKND